MCSSQCVLALLALYVGLAHSFSWDVAMSSRHRIDFYLNGTQIGTFDNPLVNTLMITSDLKNRILFVSQNNIFSYDIETQQMQFDFTLPEASIEKPSYAYDSDLDLWFWSDYTGLYSVSASKPNVKVRDTYAKSIAVDSKEGYIYWISTRPSIDRARLNGSDEEIVIRYEAFKTLQDLVIDPQTKRIYWTETDKNFHNKTATFMIKSAELNGKNITTVYETKTQLKFENALALSKDYIYWQQYSEETGIFWRLEKNSSRAKHVDPLKISTNNYVAITTNYKLQPSTNSVKDSRNISLLCVHGKADSFESDCKCEPGYTGKRCEVSLCHNFCFKGNCTISEDGLPTCRCNAGYAGKRCEVHLCEEYCLNSGVCTLDKNHMPVCKCRDDHKGERCDIPTFLVKSFNTIALFKEFLNADLTNDAAALKKIVDVDTCRSNVL